MSMREPDFPYNPETGECAAPGAAGMAKESTAQEGTLVPGGDSGKQLHSGVVQMQRFRPVGELRRPAPKVSIDLSKHAKQEKVVRYLLQAYRLCDTPEGAMILVDQKNGVVIPADPRYVVSQIQEVAHTYGDTISESTIKTAMRIIRQRGSDTVIDVMVGRVGVRADGCYQVRACLGYWIFTKPHRFPEFSPLPIIPTIWNKKSLFSSFPNRQVDAQAAIRNLMGSLPLDDDDRLLLLTWMVLVMLPWMRPVALEILGGPESGKSTLQAALKELLDPSLESLTRQLPGKERDVYSLAKDHYLISLDNVAKLSGPAQEGLSNMLKGHMIDWAETKEFSTPLITRCPLMLNGEESVIVDSALKRSTLTLGLDTQHSKTADWLNTPICRNHLLPNAFNALAQLLGEAFANVDSIKLYHKVSPQWEDFCRVGVIVTHWLGEEPEVFGKAFESLKAIDWQDAIEESPVATALTAYHKDQQEMPQTLAVKDWMEALEPYCPESRWHRARWPEHNRALGAEFGRCAKLLPHFGLRLESLGKRGSHCHWQLSKRESPAPENSCWAMINVGVMTSRREGII